MDPDRHRLWRWWAIGSMIGLISLLHYATAVGEVTRHVVYARLYYLPVVMAALTFGLRGGLLSGIAVVLLYGPSCLVAGATSVAETVELALDLAILLSVGVLVGHRVDRERHHYRSARYAERLAALGEAAAVMAHEVKRPLATIGGFVRNVLRKCTDEQDRRKLQIVTAEILRLERLVHGALDYARERPPKLDGCPVWMILDRSLQIIQPEAEERGIVISLKVGGLDGKDVLCDQDQVQQVLTNLLDNAVKHTPQGGTVQVRVDLRKEGIVFQVRDSGVGIPESLLGTLFEPFTGERHGGTGLGLAIAQRVVMLHGGQIVARNHPEGGAVFRFCLPTVPVRSSKPPAGREPREA